MASALPIAEVVTIGECRFGELFARWIQYYLKITYNVELASSRASKFAGGIEFFMCHGNTLPPVELAVEARTSHTKLAECIAQRLKCTDGKHPIMDIKIHSGLGVTLDVFLIVVVVNRLVGSSTAREQYVALVRRQNLVIEELFPLSMTLNSRTHTERLGMNDIPSLMGEFTDLVDLPAILGIESALSALVKSVFKVVCTVAIAMY